MTVRTLAPCLLVAALALLVVPGSTLAASLELAPQHLRAIREASARLQERARASAQPIPDGQVKVLEAVVMHVEGRVQWREGAESPWKTAEVDDRLRPGAMIRTGRRSSVALRVGLNGSVLVDRNSRLILPRIIQTGATLRTTAQLLRGRADFKVDRVGLTNDFSVITPSTTLAVRGTAYGVEYGGFSGTEVFAARTNVLRAIEIRYFLSRFSYYLSGAAISSDRHANPVLAALFETFGPPKMLSGLVEDGTIDEVLDDPFGRSPIYSDRAVDLSHQSTQSTLELPIFEEMDDGFEDGSTMDDGLVITLDGLGNGQIAQFICQNLFNIFVRYDQRMGDSFGEGGGPGGFSFPGLDQVFVDLEVICNGAGGQFGDQELVQIVQRIQSYCAGQFSDQTDVDLCVTNFVDSVVEQFGQ